MQILQTFFPHFSTNFHVHFFHCPTKMDSIPFSRFPRNVLLNVINHRQTNLAFTSLLTFGGLYILLASILDRSLFHPLTYNSSSVSSFPASTTSSPPYSSVTFRPFALFLLWAISLSIGHLLRLLFLPSLLGPLLVGIFLANFPSFSSLFPIPSLQISSFIVEFAFVLILLRSGLGLNVNFIRRQLALCSGLCIICPLAECLAIVLLAHFAYQIRLSTAIVFGFVLAPSSPAVIVPAILRLQAKEYGTESGVPTAVLYSTSFDNIFSLAAFSISFEIVSAQSDELSYTLTRLPIELLIGAILGILAGVLLRSFPRSDAHWVHFQRAFLLLISGCAFHFGCRLIGCTLSGPMAVFLMAATGSMQWQMDNHRRTRMEENGFRLIWELFTYPLLFLLLGTFLDFSSPPFSFALLGQSLLILLLSLAIRFISSLAIAFACFQPSQPQERIFLGLALLPKGTLQTALLPFIYHPAKNEDGFDLLGQTSLLALLLCAPIGELAIRLLGPILLRQKMLPSVATSIVPSGPTLLKGKVTHSDPRDNLLRLELGPTDPVDPPNDISPSFQPPANQMRNFRQKEKSKL